MVLGVAKITALLNFSRDNPASACFYIMCSWPVECSNEMAVRLVDGNQENEGRVEYCVDGVWRGLSIEAAEVVCRQLGSLVCLNYGHCCVSELCLASFNPR